MLPVLTATGHHDAAFTVATQTDEPSWGYWTDVAGFTALGEHWPADTRSRNHHFFGTIVQWFYEDLAGMRPLELRLPGDRVPSADPADGARFRLGVVRKRRGTVATSWRRVGAGLELDVTVPPNATGRVYVPSPTPQSISEVGSGRPVPASEALSVSLVGVEGDRVVYEVGSGSYQFRVAGDLRNPSP